MRHIPIFALILCLWGMLGCEILDETTRIQTPDWQPDIAIPLVDTKVSIEDLLNGVDSATFLTLDPEGRIGLTYETDLITATGKDIVEVPNLVIPMPTQNVAFTFPLTDIRKVGLGSGQLQLSFESLIPDAFEVTLTIQGLEKDGVDFAQTFTFNGSGSQSASADVADYLLAFINGELSLSYQARLIGSNTPVVLDQVVVELEQLTYNYAEGYFGNYVFDLANDSSSFTASPEARSARFRLDDPRLTLLIDNSFGVPIRVRFQELEFVQQDGVGINIVSQALQDGIDINYPALDEAGTFKETEIEFSKANSNLADALTEIPLALDFDVDAITHPNNDPSEIGFVTDTSEFTIGIRTEIPLRGEMSGLRLTTTRDAGLAEIDQVKEANLRIITTNGIPLETQIQIYLLDAQSQVLDSLFEERQQVLAGALVDDAGDVIEESQEIFDIALTPEKLRNVFAMEKVQLVADLATTNQGNTTVQLAERNALQIQIGFRAQF
ncbi:MAG: hypothetical protein AAFR59_07140 [Bacteroidota bacterium]